MSQSKRRAEFRSKGLPDPGLTPSVPQIAFACVIPASLEKMLLSLYEYVHEHFLNYHDFRVAIVESGLQSAAHAQREALIKKLEAEAKAKEDAKQTSLIELAPANDAALKGQGQ